MSAVADLSFLLDSLSYSYIVLEADGSWVLHPSKSHDDIMSLSNQFQGKPVWSLLGLGSSPMAEKMQGIVDEIFKSGNTNGLKDAFKQYVINGKEYQARYNLKISDEHKSLYIFVESAGATQSGVITEEKLEAIKKEFVAFKENLQMAEKMITARPLYQSLCVDFEKEVGDALKSLKEDSSSMGLDQLEQMIFKFIPAFDYFKVGTLGKYLVELRDWVINEESDHEKIGTHVVNELQQLLNILKNTNHRIGRYTGNSLDLERQNLITTKQNIELLSDEIMNNFKKIIDEKFLGQDIFELFKMFEVYLQDQCIENRLGPVEVNYIGSSFGIKLEKVDAFIPAIFHYLDNIIDHGIEPFKERKTANKSPNGKVTFCVGEAEREGVSYHRFEIIDDGRGIDATALKERLEAEGLSEDDIGTGAELLQHCFQEGFTFAPLERLNKNQHRGLGLFILKQTIDNLGGHVKLNSRSGNGTKLEILLPK